MFSHGTKLTEVDSGLGKEPGWDMGPPCYIDRYALNPSSLQLLNGFSWNLKCCQQWDTVSVGENKSLRFNEPESVLLFFHILLSFTNLTIFTISVSQEPILFLKTNLFL